MIEGIVKEAHVGEVYAAKVVRIEKFGAFRKSIWFNRMACCTFLRFLITVLTKWKMF